MEWKKFFRPTAVTVTALVFAACGAADSYESEAASEPEVAEAPAADEVTLVNPNLASQDELETIPELTPEAVEAILTGRPFSGVTDLHSALVGVVGEEAAMAAYEAIWIPANLNDASGEAFMLIPGMTDRMVHEFEEYRPYPDMDQFRREIGKYVDEAEVARLERYVTLN